MATGRDGFCTDEAAVEDIEHIDTGLDLVTFEQVQDTYAHGEDVPLSYTLGRECRPSARDWVGLYPLQWTSTKDYVTFEWAPKVLQDDRCPNRRSVLFKANCIQVQPSAENHYQFLYITKHSQVIGVSSKFYINDIFSTCIERPLGSFTSLTSISSLEVASGKGSAQSFELVNGESATSFEYVKVDSNLRLDEFFANRSSPVTSDMNLSLLFDITSSPLKKSPSSSFHLDWLFEEHQEDSGTKVTEEQDLEKLYVSVLYEPLVYEESDRRPRDICDGQWNDFFLEMMQQSLPVERQGSCGKEQAVVVYQPRHIVPRVEAGPLVLYEQPGPVVLYNPRHSLVNYARNVEEDTIVEVEEEELLIPITTRRFSPCRPQKLSVLCQNKLNFEFVLNEMSRLFADTDGPRPMRPALKPCSLSIVPFTPSLSEGKRAIKIKRKNSKCMKCVKKVGQLKRARKARNSYKGRIRSLQKKLKDTDTELYVQSTVLEKLGVNVRQISTDYMQLKDINADLRKNTTKQQNTLKAAAAQKEWLEQSFHACQAENQELKQKCTSWKDEINRIREENAEKEKQSQLEESRRTGRYLSTIASKERTIISLTTECNKLMEEQQQARLQRDEFDQLYKKSCDMTEDMSARMNKLQKEMDDKHKNGKGLSKVLGAEREKTLEAIRSRDEERRTKGEEIKRLREALKAAEQVNKQAQVCHECKGAFNSGPSLWPQYKKTSQPQKRMTSSTSQTCTVETIDETVQTSPSAPQDSQALFLPMPTINCDSSVNCDLPMPTFNCDPAVIAVGAVTNASSRPSGFIGPLQQQGPQQEVVESKKTSPTLNFFSSSLDFLSGISKSLTSTLTEEFLPPTNLDFSEDGGWFSSPVAASSTEPAAAGPSQSQENEAKSWADIVSQEEHQTVIDSNWEPKFVPYADEEEEKAIGSNWVPDFVASWKPKSGKRRTAGRGIRFDTRDQPLDRTPRAHGNRMGFGHRRGSAVQKPSVRRHMRKD